MTTKICAVDIDSFWNSKDRVDNICDVADELDKIADFIIESLRASSGTREEWTAVQLLCHAGASLRGAARQLSTL